MGADREKRIAGALISLVFVVGVVYVCSGMGRRSDAGRTEVKDVSGEPVAYELLPNELLGAFLRNRRDAEGKYVDRVVRVTGIVKTTSSSGDRASIDLLAGYQQRCVRAIFMGTRTGEPARVSPGDVVSIKGVVWGISNDVSILNCVLEKVEPSHIRAPKN